MKEIREEHHRKDLGLGKSTVTENIKRFNRINWRTPSVNRVEEG